MDNASAVTSVILTGFYEMEDLKYLYFIIFLLVYIITVAENIILIVIIYVERALHEPMYIFVCNLAFNELYGSTSLLPPILSNLVSNTHEVSLSCCQAQIYCLHTYAITEFTILALMGYDRYVAICHPLQYHSIMTFSKVCKYIALSWLYPFIAFGIFYSLALQLIICGSNIDRIYCSNYSLIKLSCVDITIVNIVGLVCLVVYSFPQLAVIIYSYIHILRICIRSSKGPQMKALKTCIPHLLALINYSIGCFFEICQSRFIFNLRYGPRIFLSLYFLIFPSLLNPVLYGMSIQAIRVRIFKLVTFKTTRTYGR